MSILMPKPRDFESAKLASRAIIYLAVLLLSSNLASADDADVRRREQAVVTIKRATEFYRTQVASHGGYVYHYSLDLSQRWGEGEATKDQIWVQPPGTPTVGLTYVAAYKATGDRYYLEAIEEVLSGMGAPVRRGVAVVAAHSAAAS